MNEFDALSIIIDTAIKHARHNQKLHGRRGGGAYVQTAMSLDDPPASATAPAASAVSIDTSTWKAHKPSARALALAEEFAAMANNPTGRFAAIQRVNNIDLEIGKKTKEYAGVLSVITAAQGSNASSSEMSSLLDAAVRIQKDINELINQRNDAAKEEEWSDLVQVHPKLALRAGRSDITHNLAKGPDPTGRIIIPPEHMVVDARLAEIADRYIAAFHSITGGDDPFKGRGFVAYSRDETGGVFEDFMTKMKIGLKGLPSEEHAGVIIVHEMAHFNEWSNPKIAKATSAFYDARTVGEETRLLNEVWAERTGKSPYNGPYPMNVYGRGDRFPTLYSGREYMDSWTGKRKTTEIFSVGVELLMTDPVGFAKSDPEYFTFIVDTMQNPDMYN